MANPIRFSILVPFFAVLVLRAQTPPPPVGQPVDVSPGAGTSPAATAGPVAGKPLVARAISPEVAAQLAASRPKFVVAPPPPPPKPEEDIPDLRETDKPKNTIVRLPKFVVQEPRPAVFRERDIYTKQGLADLAMRRYLSESDRALNRFTLPIFHPVSLLGGTSNEDRALAMYYEDERLKNMSDVADNTNMVMKSDSAAGSKMKSAAQQTFIRWSDIGWQGDKK